MKILAHNPALRCFRVILALQLASTALASTVLLAQQGALPATPPPAQSPVTAPAQPVAADGTEKGTVIDSVVAVVNGDVILESDVEEERRFESIQPYRGSVTEFSRDRAIQRLIDRTLILQQAALEPNGSLISGDELHGQIQSLRKDIPQCVQYHCETDAGWTSFLADRGFSVQEFQERWLKRMQLLKLIEVRFRSGIIITPEEIREYYEKTMLPEYARQKVAPPQLDTISTRIGEVLLQQRVGNLLRDWLKSLRAQGSVWVMKPGEVAP